MPYYISENESRISGLRISRNREILEKFCISEYKEHCRTDLPDLTRLKVDVQDVKLFEDLDDHGIPYEIYTINTQFAHEIDPDADYKMHSRAGLRMEPVSADNQGLFKTVLAEILANKGWYMYESALYRELIPQEVSKRIELEYFASFGMVPDRHAWLLFDENTCVGTFMGMSVGEVHYGTLFGVLDEFRSMGYSKEMYRMMFGHCQEAGWSKFVNEIHFQNQNSINSSLRSGLKPLKTFFNVTIYPLLSLDAEQHVSMDRSEVEKDVLASFDQTTSIRTLHLDGSKPYDRGSMYTILHNEGASFRVCHLFSGDDRAGALYIKGK